MKQIQRVLLFVMGAILLAANAHAGRWITRDPMEVQEHMERDPHPFLDLNPYTFNNNNPLSFIDPDGMAPQLVTLTGNLNGGLTGAGYVDYHQGQNYGIGLHGPQSPLWDRYTDWADQNNARFHENHPDVAGLLDNMLEYGPYGMGAMGELGELGQFGKLGKLKCPPKVANQISKAGLPTGGKTPFVPRLIKGPKGDLIIDKGEVTSGPKSGKQGYVDSQGNIWIRDQAHAGYPMHWDVQVNGGADYFRVGMDGNTVTGAK